jgi:hypothetical protein
MDKTIIETMAIVYIIAFIVAVMWLLSWII